MKIVHVIPALTKGGAERVAVSLANVAANDGHEVSMVLAYPLDPALLQDDLDPRVAVHFVIKQRSRYGAYAALPRWFARNWSWLKHCDIVHCHLTFGAAFGSFVQTLRRLNGRRLPKVVETYHAVGMEIPAWKRSLGRWLLARRDGVALMAEDPYWADFRARSSSGLIRIIPNGVTARGAVPEAKSADYRNKLGLPSDATVIGSIGRLVWERRPDALIDAFAAAALDMPPQFHLLLGGEGPERDALAARAESAGLGDRVHMPGLVCDPAMILSFLELYLTVNVGRITGVAALEAAMSGVPVVAYQMTDGYAAQDSDWIWSSSDVVALGARIASLVADSRSRKALAQVQKTHAMEHYSVEGMANTYRGLYQTALGMKEGVNGDQR